MFDGCGALGRSKRHCSRGFRGPPVRYRVLPGDVPTVVSSKLLSCVVSLLGYDDLLIVEAATKTRHDWGYAS